MVITENAGRVLLVKIGGSAVTNKEGIEDLKVASSFFTLVTGPRRSLSLKLSDTRVYEPQIRACLGTTAHF